jgi:predicted RNA-binding protein with PUA-like domain
VRNARARNIIRAMEAGQQCFFYHSNCNAPAIVGLVEVVREAYPDHTQFDPTSKYFDAKSSDDSPKWSMVDIKLVRSKLC